MWTPPASLESGDDSTNHPTNQPIAINSHPHTHLHTQGPIRYAANTAFTALVAADLGFKPDAYRAFGASQVGADAGRGKGGITK